MGDAPRGLDARAGVTVITSIVALGLALRLGGMINVWLGTGVAGALGIALSLWANPRPLRERLPIDRRSLAIGLGAGGLLCAATWLVYPLLEPWVEADVERLYAMLDDPPGRWAALPVLLLVVTAEELVFRDLVVSAVRDRLPPVWTGALAVLLYVVPQVIGGWWLLSAIAFACGIVWTALRLFTGSTWSSWICHAIWDVAFLVAFPLE